jgi:hypothetical protein
VDGAARVGVVGEDGGTGVDGDVNVGSTTLVVAREDGVEFGDAVGGSLLAV